MSVEPALVVCPHHPACPGCPLLGLPYAAQLEHKRALVVDAFALYAAVDPCLPGAETIGEPRAASNITAYRVRAKLIVDRSGLGLFERGGHAVVNIPDCLILRPAVERAVQALRTILPGRGLVTSVDVREVDEGVMVTLAVAEPAARELTELLEDVRKRVPGLVTLSLSRREHGAPRVLGSAPKVVAGALAARHTPDPAAPYHYAGSGAFTQAHSGQLTRLHLHIAAALEARLGAVVGRRVLELYAGTGALGLRLASAGARVTLVESFAPAMQLAAQAASEQGLALETHAADAAAALSALSAEGARFDAILVNPPRRGLAPEVRQGLWRLKPQVLLYVSCEPRSLARDAAHLARLGLVPYETVPYDMIPLSAAVETLTAFAAGPATLPRALHADERLIAVDKAPHEPVAPQAGYVGSLLERVREGLAAPEAVPLHDLEPGVSGVCLFARAPADVADLSLALSAAEQTYLVLAKGITHGKGTIRRALRQGRRQVFAATHYVRQSVVGGHSLLSASPEQAHRSQVQRHLSSVGHPVVGESRGDVRTNQHFEHRHGLDRGFIHLAAVRCPYGGGVLELRSALAPDLAAVLASLGGG